MALLSSPIVGLQLSNELQRFRETDQCCPELGRSRWRLRWYLLLSHWRIHWRRHVRLQHGLELNGELHLPDLALPALYKLRSKLAFTSPATCGVQRYTESVGRLLKTND